MKQVQGLVATEIGGIKFPGAGASRLPRSPRFGETVNGNRI